MLVSGCSGLRTVMSALYVAILNREAYLTLVFFRRGQVVGSEGAVETEKP